MGLAEQESGAMSRKLDSMFSGDEKFFYSTVVDDRSDGTVEAIIVVSV